MFYMGKNKKVVLGNTPTTREIYSFTPKGKYFGVRLNPKQTVVQYNCALKQIVQQPFVNVELGCTLDSKFIQSVLKREISNKGCRFVMSILVLKKGKKLG